MIAVQVRSLLLLPRWQLAACSGVHAVNDSLFAGLYPLLPLRAADLDLSYGEVGAIKTAFSGAAGISQVPGGLLAGRLGEQIVLALGWRGGLLTLALASLAFAFVSLAAVTAQIAPLSLTMRAPRPSPVA